MTATVGDCEKTDGSEGRGQRTEKYCKSQKYKKMIYERLH